MAVKDHGLEVLKKAGELVTPGDKSDMHIKVTTTTAGIAIKPSNTGLTTLKSDLTTVQFEVVAVSGQKDITITNLDAVSVHFSLTTGVSTSFSSLGRGDQLFVNNYTGSVFLIRASGTGSVQIDQRSLI